MNERHDARQAARLGIGVFFALLAVLDIALHAARTHGVPRTVRAGIAAAGLLLAALTGVHAWLSNRPPSTGRATTRAARLYAVLYVAAVLATGAAAGLGAALALAWAWGVAGAVFPWGAQ